MTPGHWHSADGVRTCELGWGCPRQRWHAWKRATKLEIENSNSEKKWLIHEKACAFLSPKFDFPTKNKRTRNPAQIQIQSYFEYGERLHIFMFCLLCIKYFFNCSIVVSSGRLWCRKFVKSPHFLKGWKIPKPAVKMRCATPQEAMEHLDQQSNFIFVQLRFHASLAIPEQPWCWDVWEALASSWTRSGGRNWRGRAQTLSGEFREKSEKTKCQLGTPMV